MADATRVQNAFTENGGLLGALTSGAKDVLDSVIPPLRGYGPYMTGSRAIVKINHKLYGFAFAVSYTINTTYEENLTIDSYVPVELMPTRISVSGTLGAFYVPGRSATKSLIQANLSSFPMHRYITIEISDQATGQIVFKTNKAMITSKTQALNAGELSTVQLTWKAIGWRDEMIPAEPPDQWLDPSVPTPP